MAIKWLRLPSEERDRLVAEKVMGWQWIPFDFDDVYPMQGQLWLLPDGESVSEITNGEWTWYLEEEEIYPEGSLFPLPHQDKHILPTWIPNYSTDMDAAWQVVREMNKPDEDGGYERYTRFIEALKKIVGSNLFFDLFYSDQDGDHLTPDRICLAALKACGVEIEV